MMKDQKMLDQGAEPAVGEVDPEERGQAEENLSPEQLVEYEKVMTAVLSMLYGDDTSHNGIVQKLKDERENLARGIGHTAAMLLKSVMGNASETGRILTPEVMLQAGVETVGELCEIAVAAGLAEDNDMELFKMAAFHATQIFGEDLLASGKVPPEMREGAKQMILEGAAEEKASGRAPKKPKGPKPKGIAARAIAEEEE